MAKQQFNLMQNGVHILNITEEAEQLKLNDDVVVALVSFLRQEGVLNSSSVTQNYTAPSVVKNIPSV